MNPLNSEIAYKGLSLREAIQLQSSNTSSVEKANVTCNCAGECVNYIYNIYKRGIPITEYQKVYKLVNGVLLCKWRILF